MSNPQLQETHLDFEVVAFVPAVPASSQIGPTCSLFVCAAPPLAGIRNLLEVRNSIGKVTGRANPLSPTPSRIKSTVKRWPDLTAIRRFDQAGTIVIGLR